MASSTDVGDVEGDAPPKKLSKRERRKLLEEQEMAKYHRSDWEVVRPYLPAVAGAILAACAAYGFWWGLCWFFSTDTLVCMILIGTPFAGVWYVTPPPERPPRARIEEIVVYPVKSCKGVRLYSATLDATCGIENDRRWMVVDADGVFVSQRRFPKLCLVAPTLPVEAPAVLRLAAPDMPTIDVPIVDAADAPRVQCRVWSDRCEGVDQGVTAGKWVSKYLRLRGCRLVRMADGAARACDPKYAPKRTHTAFSDGFPILVAARESLADLNGRLEKKKVAPLPMNRFRPNLVVAGVTKEGNAAFDEDTWKTLTRADDRLRLDVVKPCSRCKMPTIDQETGSPDGGDETTDDPKDDEGGGPRALAEPTATLKEFRTGEQLKLDNPKWKREVFFGQNVTHAAPGAASLPRAAKGLPSPRDLSRLPIAGCQRRRHLRHPTQVQIQLRDLLDAPAPPTSPPARFPQSGVARPDKLVEEEGTAEGGSNREGVVVLARFIRAAGRLVLVLVRRVLVGPATLDLGPLLRETLVPQELGVHALERAVAEVGDLRGERFAAPTRDRLSRSPRDDRGHADPRRRAVEATTTPR